MRDEYDFADSKRNPHTRKLKRQISIRLDTDTIAYFKALSEETGIPYQNLINSYLADAAANRRKPQMVWRKGS